MSNAPHAAILVGTRPEIVKMSPILRESRRRGLRVCLIHSGQHYDDAMDGRFFRDLGLPAPDVRVEGRASDGPAIARLLEGPLDAVAASSVIVHGDTNTALGGALAARALGLEIVHVEAGLRCPDERMVEEQNRRRIDALADWHFVPTRMQFDNLSREGLATARTHVVGNTIVDALGWMVPRLERRPARRGQHILMTLHRAENADPRTVATLLDGLSRVAANLEADVLWPMHPRMEAVLPDVIPERIRVVGALGWRDFLAQLSGARLIVTDSGGLQEEAMILRIPCVTLRPSTERPETLVLGANRLVPADARFEVLRDAVSAMSRVRVAAHPWGDGRTAVRILDLLERGGVVARAPDAMASEGVVA